MVELNRSDAEGLVALLAESESADWVVDRDATIERPWGWAVVWTTREYLQTRSWDAIPIGAAPYLITRRGEVFVTGSHAPVDAFVEVLEAELAPPSGFLARIVARLRNRASGAEPLRIPDDHVLAALPEGEPLRDLYRRARGL